MDNNKENNNFNSEPNNFGLPKGYFRNSANSIVNKIEWLDEHKEFPFLLNLKKDSGFIAPQNYFRDNEFKLELLAYPKLSSLIKTAGFKTPENYFKTIEEKQFIELFTDNENENSSKILNTIPKKTAFKVDDDYFDVSAKKINSTLLNGNNKSGRVIKLFSPKFYYAAAAILTITLGLWIYNQYFKIEQLKDCGTLACVDKVDLLKAKNLESIDNDELYELVDTKKLEEKLENKTNTKSKAKDIDTSLNDVSVDDLLDEI